MSQRIAAFDWSKTSLGPVSDWPNHLKTTVNLVLFSPIPMTLLWGREGTMLYNDAYAAFAAGKHPHILGQPVLEAWPEVSVLTEHIMDASFDGRPLSYPNQKLTLDRNNRPEDVWVDLYCTPVLAEDSKVMGVISTVVDITDRVQETQALNEARQEYQSLFTFARDAILITDDEGRYLNVNPAACELLGLNKDQLIGRTIQEVFLPDQEQQFKAMWQAFLKQGFMAGEMSYVTPEGHCKDFDFSATAHYLPNRHLSALRDITERKQVAQALLESEARFRIMADASPSFVWTLGPDGSITYLNKAGLDFYALSDFSQFNSETWLNNVHPDDREATMQAVRNALENGVPYRVEHRALGAHGEYRWFLSAGNPSYLPNGELYGYIGSSVDITLAKQAQEDLQAYAYRLERSNRELEQFATVASHDLKAPLRKIATFSGALQETDGEHLSEEGRDYLARINRSAERMDTLTTDLLALSRVNRKGKPFKSVDLKSLLQEVVSELKPCQDDVQGQIEIGDLPVICGDASQLSQLFENLLSNALKFHRKDVPPVVRVYARALSDGQYAIAVQDNGIGLKPEYAERIFEIFERLHGQNDYDGTGIGLAVAKKIAERHQGCITVESTPGAGSTFTVNLPENPRQS